MENIQKGEVRSFCVEGFDHEGYSTGRTEVQSAGLYEASFCDLSNPMTDRSNLSEVYFCTLSKIFFTRNKFNFCTMCIF